MKGQLRVCQGTLCCYLQYRRSQPGGGELYALGAFAGTHTVNGRYALQVRPKTLNTEGRSVLTVGVFDSLLEGSG